MLVDCGQFEEQAHNVIEEELNKHGLQLQNIDEIWLTHGHPDHFGQAARLAELSGATVYGHRKEEANFACNSDRELFAIFFDNHGIPGHSIQQMVEQLDWLQQFQRPIEPKWIQEGDTLNSGTLQFEVLHMPGHSAGHLIFVEQDEIIFGGDLLLDHITTNALINFDPDTDARNKSLLQYRNSLEKLRGHTGILLPGHGETILDIPATVEHHLSEHEVRYADVLKALKAEPRSLLEVSLQLFPEPMRKGDLFLVFSEVMGYLDWGVKENKVHEIMDEDQVRYQTK